MAYYRIRLRRDTAANWTSANPTLDLGEIGVETDTNRQKFGNGTTKWNYLPYSTITEIENIGPGNGLYSNIVNGGKLQLKSLVSGTAITINSNPDNLNIGVDTTAMNTLIDNRITANSNVIKPSQIEALKTELRGNMDTKDLALEAKINTTINDTATNLTKTLHDDMDEKDADVIVTVEEIMKNDIAIALEGVDEKDVEVLRLANEYTDNKIDALNINVISSGKLDNVATRIIDLSTLADPVYPLGTVTTTSLNLIFINTRTDNLEIPINNASILARNSDFYLNIYIEQATIISLSNTDSPIPTEVNIKLRPGYTQMLYSKSANRWYMTNYFNKDNHITKDEVNTLLTTVAKLNEENTYMKRQIGNVSKLSSNGNLVLNLSTSNNFEISVEGNTVLSNPTNIVVGQAGRILLRMKGNYTMSFGTYWKFPYKVEPVLELTTNALNVLAFEVLSPTEILLTSSANVGR